MKIFHQYGSKEKLFQMMKRVNRLNEEILPKEQREELVEKFISFLDSELGLNGNFPIVNLSYDDKEAQLMKSYGQYNPSNNELKVIAVNRSLGDILRTIAHEFIHHKQKGDGKIDSKSGETGSNEENEANALAGVLMRKFGQNNPIIFE